MPRVEGFSNINYIQLIRLYNMWYSLPKERIPEMQIGLLKLIYAFIMPITYMLTTCCMHASELAVMNVSNNLPIIFVLGL